jgi:hypothetical protein
MPAGPSVPQVMPTEIYDFRSFQGTAPTSGINLAQWPTCIGKYRCGVLTELPLQDVHIQLAEANGDVFSLSPCQPEPKPFGALSPLAPIRASLHLPALDQWQVQKARRRAGEPAGPSSSVVLVPK